MEGLTSLRLVLLCLSLSAAVSYATLLIRPLDRDDHRIILLAGTLGGATSSSCSIVKEPNITYNASVGLSLNISVITVNCSAILLNISGNIISNSPSFTQFYPDQEGTHSVYMEGLYTFSNISLNNDGETIQFLAYGTKGGTPDYSVIATLNVQGPPGPVSKLSCHFLTQDIVKVSYNEPQSLVGVETKYLIALPGLSANTITTDGSTVNVTLPNITALDFFKSYNITVTSFNSGSVGNTSSCTIFIPNATQIANSVISVVLVNDSKNAKINMTTELLDTKDNPLCPGCYPDTVLMFVNSLPGGRIKQYESSVPAGETKFYMGNISVQKNARLNAVIYYCNVAECVMTKTELNTFDLQKVEVKSVSNRKVCLTCVFTRGSIGNGCVIKLHLNTDEIFEFITSAKKHNLAINECYDVSIFYSNHYYWEAFASKNGLELSSRPAFTGNLTIQHVKTSPSFEVPTSDDHPFPSLLVAIAVTVSCICFLFFIGIMIIIPVIAYFRIRNCSRNNMVQLQDVLVTEDDNKLSVGGTAFLLSAPVHAESPTGLSAISENDENDHDDEDAIAVELPGRVENEAIEVECPKEEYASTAKNPSIGPSKSKKRPVSLIILPTLNTKSDIILSPHAISQPTTPIVFTFEPQQLPTGNNSFHQPTPSSSSPFPPS